MFGDVQSRPYSASSFLSSSASTTKKTSCNEMYTIRRFSPTRQVWWNKGNLNCLSNNGVHWEKAPRVMFLNKVVGK